MASFGKLGELYKMQKEAREMQKKMKALIIEGESKDGLVVVSINGTQEIEDISIDDSLMEVDKKEDLIKRIKQAVKAANKKLQKEMMKDMDLGKLKGMLGM
ncbi:MAG: YbaB/EbfC family nucleoid-associated protein [Candidatus Dojkabacteria bacterium]|jgi:DNA-binding YbaB/EbfC family protein|nr:YbaB/EbfC family nucleoid-associated protein [Candidatus Dojkabacteria bacterium]